MAERFGAFSGQYRLPVPSHDTSLWYAAERGRYGYARIKMKSHFWTNCPRMAGLKDTVAKVLNG